MRVGGCGYNINLSRWEFCQNIWVIATVAKGDLTSDHTISLTLLLPFVSVLYFKRISLHHHSFIACSHTLYFLFRDRRALACSRLQDSRVQIEKIVCCWKGFRVIYSLRVVKSTRTRGSREETGLRRAGSRKGPFAGPSRLRRSLALSHAARFARPNRRACSQAT